MKIATNDDEINKVINLVKDDKARFYLNSLYGLGQELQNSPESLLTLNLCIIDLATYFNAITEGIQMLELSIHRGNGK